MVPSVLFMCISGNQRNPASSCEKLGLESNGSFLFFFLSLWAASIFTNSRESLRPAWNDPYSQESLWSHGSTSWQQYQLREKSGIKFPLLWEICSLLTRWLHSHLNCWLKMESLIYGGFGVVWKWGRVSFIHPSTPEHTASGMQPTGWVLPSCGTSGWGRKCNCISSQKQVKSGAAKTSCWIQAASWDCGVFGEFSPSTWQNTLTWKI